MDNEVLENHKRYLERVSFYKRFGYNLEQERDFILDKSLPFSGRILEVGTGKGHFMLCLAKRGYSFVSVDVSEEEQKIAMLNLWYYGLEKNVYFRTEDAQYLSFPDKSFDVIFCVNVFHHLENPLAVLDEIIRLLNMKGKAVLSDFNVNGLEIINACHLHEGRKHDYLKCDLNEATNHFLGKGFEIQEFESEVQSVIIAEKN